MARNHSRLRITPSEYFVPAIFAVQREMTGELAMFGWSVLFPNTAEALFIRTDPAGRERFMFRDALSDRGYVDYGNLLVASSMEELTGERGSYFVFGVRDPADVISRAMGSYGRLMPDYVQRRFDQRIWHRLTYPEAVQTLGRPLTLPLKGDVTLDAQQRLRAERLISPNMMLTWRWA